MDKNKIIKKKKSQPDIMCNTFCTLYDIIYIINVEYNVFRTERR